MEELAILTVEYASVEVNEYLTLYIQLIPVYLIWLGICSESVTELAVLLTKCKFLAVTPKDA